MSQIRTFVAGATTMAAALVAITTLSGACVTTTTHRGEAFLADPQSPAQFAALNDRLLGSAISTSARWRSRSHPLTTSRMPGARTKRAIAPMVRCACAA